MGRIHKKYTDPKNRILLNIEVDEETGCWNWLRCVNFYGYGKLGFERVTWKAHRLSWTLFRGEIPEGLFVCHHCDNCLCCNPEHLFVGTNQDNQDDMMAKGRSCRGEGKYQAKLTRDEVGTIRHCYAVGAGTMKEIGYGFGVCAATVCNIVHRKTWKHLDAGGKP